MSQNFINNSSIRDLVCFWSVKDIKIETSVRLQVRCRQLDQLSVDLRCTGQPQSILVLDKLSDRWSSRSKRPPCETTGTFRFVSTSTCTSVCYYSQASLCFFLLEELAKIPGQHATATAPRISKATRHPDLQLWCHSCNKDWPIIISGSFLPLLGTFSEEDDKLDPTVNRCLTMWFRSVCGFEDRKNSLFDYLTFELLKSRDCWAWGESERSLAAWPQNYTSVSLSLTCSHLQTA